MMTYEITDFMGNRLTVKPRLQLYSTRDFMGKMMPGIAIALDQITDGQSDDTVCLQFPSESSSE